MNKSELHLAAAKWQHVATLEGSSTCFGHATDLRSAFWINTLATHTWPATRHLILNVNNIRKLSHLERVFCLSFQVVF
jgi:hypothetical protein